MCYSSPCSVYHDVYSSVCALCSILFVTENVFEIGYRDAMAVDDLYIRQSFMIPANVTAVQMRWVYGWMEELCHVRTYVRRTWCVCCVSVCVCVLCVSVWQCAPVCAWFRCAPMHVHQCLADPLHLEGI